MDNYERLHGISSTPHIIDWTKPVPPVAARFPGFQPRAVAPHLTALSTSAFEPSESATQSQTSTSSYRSKDLVPDLGEYACAYASQQSGRGVQDPLYQVPNRPQRLEIYRAPSLSRRNAYDTPGYPYAPTQPSLPFNRPVLSAVRGTDGDHELRRTALHETFRSTVGAPPTMISNERAKHMNQFDSRTYGGAPMSESSYPPASYRNLEAALDTFPTDKPRGLDTYFDPSIDTTRLSDDELRATQTAKPSLKAQGPFFTREGIKLSCDRKTNQSKPYDMSYEDRLDAWWNSGRKEIDRQQERVKHLLNSRGQSNDQEAHMVVSLFVSLHERLEEYVKESSTARSRKQVEYFARFKAPPEWCVDRSSATAGSSFTTGGEEKVKSLFGEKQWSTAPQRIGRDPRYAPLRGAAFGPEAMMPAGIGSMMSRFG